jgi:signal-transduction protein with cAMP-binding, CBS, and nucleotidyltransferase domain
VDADDQPIGIVTSTDLVEEHPPGLGVTEVMSTKVYVVPRYEDVHIAARVMRNHGIHHVVVTEGRKVVGVLSSWDLLKLVEEHRFVMKQPPTESERHGNHRV